MMNIQDVETYWNQRPCNIRHSNKPIGSLQYFNDVEHKKYFVEPHIPKFADFEKWKGKKVLEIGCGIGTDSINFAKAGANLTCIDLSEESLNLTKERFKVFGLDANFYVANSESLSDYVPIEEYDLVYSFGVIHHTPHPERAISEIKKYMGKNTELRMMVYTKYSYKLFWLMHELEDWNFKDAGTIIQRYSEAEVGCPCTYTYTYVDIYELLKGFKVDRIWKDHIFKYEIEPYKNGEYIIDKSFQGMSPNEFSEMERALGWHTMVIAKLE